MKEVVYFLFKYFTRLITYLYFVKIEIKGLDKIPAGSPIIFSCNHQNAFMDALIVGCFSPIKLTSLTRADVFGGFGSWFMDAIGMLPIYRIRDGFDKLALNQKTFDLVRQRLKNNESILIFSEGNHGNEYYLRPLSKGNSRLALESQEEIKNQDVYVVPIGLNYFNHQRPFHKLMIVFGEGINVKKFLPEYIEQPAKAINNLKDNIAKDMESCLLLPKNNENYENKKLMINHFSEKYDYKTLKSKLENNETLKYTPKTNKFLYFLGLFFGIMNFLPLMLVEKTLKNFKDIVFHGSVKWVATFTLFPIWWILLFIIFSLIFNIKIGFIIFSSCIITIYIRQYLLKISNLPHKKAI